MMCDLVDFTAIADRLDPEELAEALRAYREHSTAAITHHGGVVAQYVGDAIVAYFGYPRAHEDDAERAVRAALELVQDGPRALPWIGDAHVHIGIATGPVVVGTSA